MSSSGAGVCGWPGTRSHTQGSAGLAFTDAARPAAAYSGIGPKGARSPRTPLASCDEHSLAVHPLVEFVVEHCAGAMPDDGRDLKPGLLGEFPDLFHR